MSMRVTVIMCTYNRQQSLCGAIDSILAQRTDSGFQYDLLVVDNNSKDRTAQTIREYETRFPGKVKYVLEQKQGKTFALNRGIQEAKGQVLVFTDDDIVADPHWLAAIVQCFSSYSCDAVGGRVLPVYPQGTPSWVKENAVKMAGGVVIYDQGPDSKRIDGSAERFIGANIAVKREIFDECGMFREDLGPGQKMMGGEDSELFYRLLNRKKVIYYCAQALIWHPVDPKRLTLGHMARWHIALGRFHARMEFEDKSKKFVYSFGVPRYLFKGMAGDLMCAALNSFDRLKFLNYFRAFFRKLGMIKEYREIYKNKMSGRLQNA